MMMLLCLLEKYSDPVFLGLSFLIYKKNEQTRSEVAQWHPRGCFVWPMQGFVCVYMFKTIFVENKIAVVAMRIQLQNSYFRKCNWPKGSSCCTLKSMTVFALRIPCFQHASAIVVGKLKHTSLWKTWHSSVYQLWLKNSQNVLLNLP